MPSWIALKALDDDLLAGLHAFLDHPERIDALGPTFTLRNDTFSLRRRRATL